MKNNTILEFFDFWSSKIMNCFLTKNTVCKLDFFKPNERKSIKFLSGLGVLNWNQVFVLPLVFVVILLMDYRVNAQGAIKGIVPIAIPVTGTGIDGDAFAHEPIDTLYEGVGDLFDRLHPTIAGHGVVSPVTGEVFYKPTEPVTVPVSYFLQDPYQNDPTIFTLSNKINDNPNTYTWGAGISPNKNEIQNCGAHLVMVIRA